MVIADGEVGCAGELEERPAAEDVVVFDRSAIGCAGEGDGIGRAGLDEVIGDLIGAAAGDGDAGSADGIGVDGDVAAGGNIDAAEELQAAQRDVAGGGDGDQAVNSRSCARGGDDGD